MTARQNHEHHLAPGTNPPRPTRIRVKRASPGLETSPPSSAPALTKKSATTTRPLGAPPLAPVEATASAVTPTPAPHRGKTGAQQLEAYLEKKKRQDAAKEAKAASRLNGDTEVDARESSRFDRCNSDGAPLEDEFDFAGGETSREWSMVGWTAYRSDRRRRGYHG